MTLDSRAEELLRAVAASPDDDGPRLVFADHIADRWPAHAAWIVAQCTGREDMALLEAFRAELPPCLRDQCRTRRGFFETWEWLLEARDFVEIDPDVLFRLAPWCTAVSLQDVTDVDAIAARMPRFDALAIVASGIEATSEIAAAPGLAHLRTLAFRHMRATPLLEHVFRTTSFVKLERLEIDGRHDPEDPSDESFLAITSAPFAQTLRALDVAGYRFSHLVDAVQGLPQLRELDAATSTIDARFATLPHRFDRLGADSCGIDDDAAAAIAESDLVSELSYLTAIANPWGAEGCARFLTACESLRELYCGAVEWNADALGRVFRGMRARTTLENISLFAQLGPAGIRALAETEFPRLRHLGLNDTTIRDGLLAFLRAPFLRQLESLAIRPEGLTVSTAHAFVDALGKRTRLIILGPLEHEVRSVLRDRLGARLIG